MSIARDRANRAGSDPLVIGASKISSNASDDLVVQDTSNNAKRLITSEMQIGDDDNDKIIIKRDSSTGKVNLQTVSGGGSPADQPTGGLTVYANTSNLPASADEGVMALVTANNFMYIYRSGWYKVAEITNATPTVSSAGNASYSFATDGTPVSIEVTASDPEGVPLQYKYTVTSGSLTNGGGATAAVTSSATSGGTYSALAENTLTSNKYFKITPSTNSSYAGAFSLTFHASDGVNVANSSASAFTLAFSHDIEILLVGGGGSGGKAGFTDYQSGGGGGGGVILSGTYAYSPGTQLDIVVGAGGAGIAGSTARSIGNTGVASSIKVNGAGSFLALARGGGAGGSGNNSAATEVGGNGANGGGGYAINGGTSGIDDPGMGYGINGVEVAGFHGFGHWGGYGGGGGGGAGADATDQHGGDGVNTYSTWATATSTGDSGYYGGGGAGSKYDGANATFNGGQGGGGDGTFSSGQTWVGQDGAANTGGGGGAGGGRAGNGAAGAGGSGIVIIRYAGAAKNSQGDSVHTSGGYTYHVYSSTGSATYTG